MSATLALSTNAAGVIHFSTTEGARVRSLGAYWVETTFEKPPFKPVAGYGSTQIQRDREQYAALPEVQHFSYSNNAFVLEGIDEKLVVGKKDLSYVVHHPPKSIEYDFKPPCVTSLPSKSAEYAEIDAPVHLQRIWVLVNKAFDDDLFVTVKGTVSNNVSSPSEATVRAALSRAAAGEAIVIPATTATRTLYVTDVVVSRTCAVLSAMDSLILM